MGGKNPRLANGLIGAAVDQLRRTIRRQQHQFFTGQTGFDQRRIEVSHRRAGGHNHRYRLMAGFCQPQRQMAETALIKMGVMNKGAVFGGGQGQRR